MSSGDWKAAIDSAIDHWAKSLHVISAGINGSAALRAIAQVETGYGRQGLATLHEAAYCYGGRYYLGSADLQRLSLTYGCLAHQSYGPWQILFVTAYEVGFRGDPVELREPSRSVEYVVGVLNLRTLDKLMDATVEDLFDAWNTGRARDRFTAPDYVKKAKGHYLAALAAGPTA